MVARFVIDVDYGWNLIQWPDLDRHYIILDLGATPFGLYD